jgi:hypothetical protein
MRVQTPDYFDEMVIEVQDKSNKEAETIAMNRTNKKLRQPLILSN